MYAFRTTVDVFANIWTLRMAPVSPESAVSHMTAWTPVSMGDDVTIGDDVTMWNS